MSKILVPKTRIGLNPDWPLYFFGGPVRGGGDWQVQMYEYIGHYEGPNFYAAIPCRWGPEHPLASHFAQGGSEFDRQLTWEHHYLEIAGNRARSPRGCILFWIPPESKTDPRTDGTTYARDTFQEIGEWRGRMVHEHNLRVIIGADPEFDPDGIDVMRRKFQLMLGRSVTIYKQMWEVAAAAVNLAHTY